MSNYQKEYDTICKTSKINLCKNGVKSFGGINERFEILPVATL